MVVVLHNQGFNGGFHQYFVNGYGQFAINTVECLKLIGSDEKANILKDAYNIVNYEKFEEQEFRKALLERRIEKLFVTDELFDTLDEIDEKYEN